MFQNEKKNSEQVFFQSTGCEKVKHFEWIIQTKKHPVRCE